MGQPSRVVFLLLGVLALLVLGMVSTSLLAAVDQYDREPEDVYLMVFYVCALAVAAALWLLASARRLKSPRWLSVALVFVAVPGLLIGLVVGALSVLSLADPVNVLILVPAALCVLTALVVLFRELPQVSAVHDERYSSRWAGGERHDAV